MNVASRATSTVLPRRAALMLRMVPEAMGCWAAAVVCGKPVARGVGSSVEKGEGVNCVGSRGGLHL